MMVHSRFDVFNHLPHPRRPLKLTIAIASLCHRARVTWGI